MIARNSPLALLDQILIHARQDHKGRKVQVVGLPVESYATAVDQMQKLDQAGKLKYRLIADHDEYNRPNFLFRGTRICAVPGQAITLTWIEKE